MTREEAITYGKRVIDLGLNDETQAFCEMAIKALDQEPCEDANANQHNSNELNDVGQRTNALEGDVISRQAAIRIAEQGQVQGYEWQFKELNKLPPVTPQPKTGHWIDIMVGDMPAQACDQCNIFYPLAYTGGGHKYCPNCGAKMVEPQESEG